VLTVAKKRAFTIVEILIASSILSFILLVGISIMALISTTLYDGQIESGNRISITDNIYYITREIQSAEKIIVTDKTLKIKQFGSSDFSLEYTMTDGYPFGNLDFKGKKMLDLDYSKSKFSLNGKSIKIELAILKNNLDFKQQSQIVVFDVTPRSEGALIE